MNRRTWWTALLAACGVAKAQGASSWTIKRMVVRNGKPKPRNNECPVCGTMAPPYGPIMPVVSLPNTYYHHEPDGSISAKPLPRVKAANLTRCEWCNCAFWRDEEAQ